MISVHPRPNAEIIEKARKIPNVKPRRIGQLCGNLAKQVCRQPYATKMSVSLLLANSVGRADGPCPTTDFRIAQSQGQRGVRPESSANLVSSSRSGGYSPRHRPRSRFGLCQSNAARELCFPKAYLPFGQLGCCAPAARTFTRNVYGVERDDKSHGAKSVTGGAGRPRDRAHSPPPARRSRR